ncbi:MAG: BlaI/MecI/CopY family transcriptional regulator [Planctomycetales bacterium]|nr:BlaI/MecI/CopY family transcriptional regulator [Planctomycetales bacterium]
MAPSQDDKLTPAQFEILETVWASDRGATVAEIWEVIGQRRDVARTTVLNLVQRLAKRGWLRREKGDGGFRYQATVTRNDAAASVASQFVDDFFSGSTSEMVLSLLGSRHIDPAELERIERLLAAHRFDSQDTLANTQDSEEPS